MDLPTFALPPWQLRPFAAHDVALYVALFTDAEVMAHIEPPLSAERALGCAQRALWHQQQDNPRFLHWVLCDSTGTTGGLFAVARQTAEWAGGEADFGIMLAHDSRRNGAAERGTKALLPWLINGLKLRRVVASHHPDNRAVAWLARRCRFSALPPAGQGIQAFRWQWPAAATQQSEAR